MVTPSLPNPEYFYASPAIRCDYEEVVLRFICSSKGGLGKTTLTESMLISMVTHDPNECMVCRKKFKKLTLGHLKDHNMTWLGYENFLKRLADLYNPVVIDANSNNQDLVAIFSGFVLASHIVETDELVMKEFKVSEGGKSTFILVYPKAKLHTAEDMYKFVQLVIDSIPTRRSFIVDSAFHLERFVIEGSTSDAMEYPPLHEDIKPEFWFLWRWSAPVNYIEMGKIEWAVEWLSRNFKTWTDDSLVSVFNLYDLYHQTTDRNLNIIVRRWDGAKSGDYVLTPVPFGDLISKVYELRRAIRGYRVGKTIEISKVPSLWVSLFEAVLADMKDEHGAKPVVPTNVLIIPTYHRSLVMTIDGITLDQPTDLMDIERGISRFIDRIRKFLRLKAIKLLQSQK